MYFYFLLDLSTDWQLTVFVMILTVVDRIISVNTQPIEIWPYEYCWSQNFSILNFFPCCDGCIPSFGWLPGVLIILVDVSEQAVPPSCIAETRKSDIWRWNRLIALQRRYRNSIVQRITQKNNYNNHEVLQFVCVAVAMLCLHNVNIHVYCVSVPWIIRSVMSTRVGILILATPR